MTKGFSPLCIGQIGNNPVIRKFVVQVHTKSAAFREHQATRMEYLQLIAD
jgi:hypothetical protein